MSDIEALRRHLLGLGRIVLGYSGGVDSALLAVVGRQTLGTERFLAVVGRSASYPESQWHAARELAREFDIPLLEVGTGELDDPHYLVNAPDRCYFCKAELWRRLTAVARERDFDVVVDGTNADDLSQHRPGLKAAQEWRIRSPLAELGWSKAAVRATSRTLGLPTWDTPSGPCLSSRVMYGLAITPTRLRQIEEGEAYLRGLGVAGDLRVRHHGPRARIEVSAEELARVREAFAAVTAFFKNLGFEDVELDPAGYRRGGLLALARR